MCSGSWIYTNRSSENRKLKRYKFIWWFYFCFVFHSLIFHIDNQPRGSFVNRQVLLAYLLAQSLTSFLNALSILATKLTCQTKKVNTFSSIPLNLHHNIDDVVVLAPSGGQFHQIRYLVHFRLTKNTMSCWSAQVYLVVSNYFSN